MHKYFAATGCPGPYLESKFPYIAKEVNKRLIVKDKHEYAVECACNLEDKTGLEKPTINWLWKYKYADDLFIKLWEAMK